MKGDRLGETHLIEAPAAICRCPVLGILGKRREPRSDAGSHLTTEHGSRELVGTSEPLERWPPPIDLKQALFGISTNTRPRGAFGNASDKHGKFAWSFRPQTHRSRHIYHCNGITGVL